MADEQIRIDVTARDDASKVLDDVADTAKDLEKLDPEITATADTAAALTDLKDVGAVAEALSAADRQIVLKARIDDAKGELKQLRTELDQTGEKAEDTARQLDRVGGDGGGGIQTRGNAIADLTGPLGEASGAASDFAGVFDGLGDIAGDVAGKLGASQQTAAQVSSALGGLGIAVAAGAALWSIYQSRQQKAREEAARMLETTKKLNAAMAEGDAAEWAAAFQEAFPDAVKAADRLGVSIRGVTEFITGQRDEIPNLIARQDLLRAAFADAGLSAQDAAAKTAEVTRMITDAREAYASGRTSVGEYDLQLSQIAQAMPGYARRTDDLTDSTDELTGATERGQRSTERAARAQDEAARKADATTDAYGRLRDALNIEDAVDRFNEAFLLAADAINHHAPDAAGKVRDLKNAVIDLAEQTEQNPAEVRITLQKIDSRDLAGVKSDAEDYYRRNPILATVKASGATVSGGGGGSVRPTSMPVDGPVTVVQNIPRGYRGDLLADARRASRRAGHRYQRAGA